MMERGGRGEHVADAERGEGGFNAKTAKGAKGGSGAGRVRPLGVAEFFANLANFALTSRPVHSGGAEPEPTNFVSRKSKAAARGDRHCADWPVLHDLRLRPGRAARVRAGRLRHRADPVPGVRRVPTGRRGASLGPTRQAGRLAAAVAVGAVAAVHDGVHRRRGVRACAVHGLRGGVSPRGLDRRDQRHAFPLGPGFGALVGARGPGRAFGSGVEPVGLGRLVGRGTCCGRCRSAGPLGCGSRPV